MANEPSLINDAHDFGHPLPKRREAPWEKLYRFFFGDDIFISYSRSDAIRYVPKLAARLTAEKHICFFDQLVPDPNEDLPRTLRNKILRSTVFVLIGTKGAVSSNFVRKEIELFRSTGRPFIPVDVDGALVARRDWNHVLGVAKIREEGERVLSGDPSPEVVSLIKDSFRYTRRSQWLRASLVAGVSVILITAAVSLLVIGTARAQAHLAESAVSKANQKLAATNRQIEQQSQQLESFKADTHRLGEEAEAARNSAKTSAEQQKMAENATRQAQMLERRSTERAAETSRREAGSRAALLSREPGMDAEALALAVDSAEKSIANRGDFSDEVFDGIVASVNATDYSIPLDKPRALDWPNALMISPDGEKIVASFNTYDPQPQGTRTLVWDSRTGKILFDISGVGLRPPLAFSRNGNRLAAIAFSAGEGFLDLWELTGARMTHLATACGKGINGQYSIALDNNGSHVIIGKPPSMFAQLPDTQPPIVTVCEIATGREELLPGLEDTLSVAFTPENEPAVYGTSPNSTATTTRPFMLFPRSGRKIMLKVPSAPPIPRFASFANDGSIVLTIIAGDTPGQSRVYVQRRDGTTRRFGGYRGAIISAAYVSDQMRAVAINGRSLRVVDGRGLPNFAALRGHVREVDVATFSPDDRTILTVSDDGMGRLWDGETGNLLQTLHIADEFLDERPLINYRPKRAAFRADGRRLATADNKGGVQMWDVNTGRLVCSAPGPNVSPEYPQGIPWGLPGGNYVNGISFLAGGDYVLAAYGSFINFLDARNCSFVGTFRFDVPAAFLSFSLDGATMITSPVVQKTNTALKEALLAAAPLENPKFQSWNLRGVDFSGAGIRLSFVDLSDPPGSFQGYSNDGNLMLIWVGATLQMWRRSEARPIRLDGAKFGSRFDINASTFSADGTRVAVVSGREARVWDTRSGKLLVTFKDEIQANWTSLISLSSDGSRLLIVGKDNTVRIYPTSRKDFLGVAKHLLGR